MIFMKKTIIPALGMPSFERKQIHEFQAIVDMGYSIVSFSNDCMNQSDIEIKKIKGDAEHITLKKRFLARFLQVNAYLKSHKKQIYLAHIYPGGRFSSVYILLCKVYGIRTVSVEWGTLLDWNKLSLLTKFSMIICYRYSNVIWYKEPYMKKMIENLGGKNLFFIHNCFNGKIASIKPLAGRNYDFLWVNRLIPARKIFWFSNALKDTKLKKTNNLLLGMQDSQEVDNRIIITQDKLLSNKPANLKLISLSDPFDYYSNAVFFVLPASIVFGNNSLIEAMSYGMIPIVTKSSGIELIIEDGVNGFVADYSKESFRDKMIYARSLGGKELEMISSNAIKTVSTYFSNKKWSENIKALYKEAVS